MYLSTEVPTSHRFGADGEAIAASLQREYGVQGVDIHYRPNGVRLRPMERQGWTSVVVTDKVASGVILNDLKQEGKARRQAGETPVLFLLCPPSRRLEQQLKRSWADVLWIRRPAASNLKAQVEQLLAVASLVMEVEAGLLRCLRVVIRRARRASRTVGLVST